MAEVIIQYAEKIADLTLNGTVKKGDPLAHNGTNWVQADASDATTNLYAQYIAMQGGVSGNKIKGCKTCVLYDADAPYTANTTAYVSATAGAITHTRPTANGDVIQVIGRGITTYECQIDIKEPVEVPVYIPCPPYNQLSGVEAHAADPTETAWAGADADDAAVAAVFTGWFPSGLVGGILAADLIIDTQAATAVDIDVTYVRAYINQSCDGDTGAAQTALSTSATTATNKIMKVDISAGMDADFVKAGTPWGVSVDPDAGDFIILGMYMRYLVV